MWATASGRLPVLIPDAQISNHAPQTSDIHGHQSPLDSFSRIAGYGE